MKWFSKEAGSYVGQIFVIDGGVYAGEYLVVMEEKNDMVYCLVLPDKQKREIKKEDFKRGLDLKILTFLEKLPKYVLKVCKSEYNTLNKGVWTSLDQSELQAQSVDNLLHQKLLPLTTANKL
jgi:hypothetical protein